MARAAAVYPNPYTHWRKQVLARDGYKCVACSATTELQADHIKPRRDFPALCYEVDNGRTLCKPCHKLTPTYGGKLLKGTRINRDPYGSR